MSFQIYRTICMTMELTLGALENFIIYPKTRGGLDKITSTQVPYREVLYLQDIDKRVIRLARTDGLEISPIQNGGQLEFDK